MYDENIETHIKRLYNQFAPTGQEQIVYSDVVQVLRYTKRLVSFLYNFCPALTQNRFVCTGL